MLDDDDVVHLLRATVKREGSQSAVAKRYGVDRGTMNSILNGKRRVSANLLKAFGLTLANITDPHFNHTTLSLLHLGSIHSTCLDLRLAVVDLTARYRTAPYTNPRSCVRSKTSLSAFET